ncbi:MAG: ABC transporter ATP-binding protein [Gammaproteobacteria bacterium]|nr:ABC transporter ATP-binding protein [Gammaproteobacteria bacterium]
MNALEIEGLEKVYANGTRALHGIDLVVESGDFFALLGPNGAGKSTTIGIISSLVRKTAGTIRVFGHDLTRQWFEARLSLGIVPQEINFSQFETGLEIVVNQAGYYGLRRRLAMERAEKYLGLLGLWERRNDPSRTLSGGYKRRLMIARALMHEPRLLILDEPTAGVDVELRRSMWTFLQDINRGGTTIVLTTHYLEEAESLCRHLAIIDEGRIIERTSIKKLLATLPTETFVLDLDATLDTLPDLPHYALRLRDPSTLEVEMTRGQDMNDLFVRLTQSNVRIRSMRNKSNRLEELFLRLVNRNPELTNDNGQA